VAAIVTFEESCHAIDGILAAERTDARLDPTCLTRLMVHGAPTDRVIVFYHGFTNCPKQFETIGARFFAAGYNVYIPRLPGHGYLDKMTDALAGVTIEEIMAAAAAAARAAVGLGRRVHVAGISMGGILAETVGMTEMPASATGISPFLAIARVPMWLDTIIAWVLKLLPNFFLWWDPRTKADNPLAPPHAYMRYPAHLLAGQLLESGRLQREAKKRLPAARVSCLFLNVHDPAINTKTAERLYDRWKRNGARVLREHLDLGALPHDIIDDFDPQLPIDMIYPAILALVDRADAASLAVD
jgi:alpha-beta hydrolase superfamily lysophospholipase